MIPAMCSLDVGTSGIRALAYDLKGKLIAQGKSAYSTYYPKPGWAEQVPMDWAEASLVALAKMQEEMPQSFCPVVLTITGQCPSYVPLDKELKPLGNALIYQDNRAVVEADWLGAQVGAERLHRITGHSPWAFYILPKVLWQRNHQPELFQAIGKIVQPTDYVCYFLTNQLVTDRTHANATLLYDIRKAKWSDDLMSEIGLSSDLVPDTVLQPWDQVGTIKDVLADKLGLPKGLPIVIGAADSQCSCLGTGTLGLNQISEMSGTSSCLNSTVREPLEHPAVGHYHHIIPDMYCTEMGLNTTGAAIAWFIDGILGWQSGIYEQAQREAEMVGADDVGDLLFVPYLCDGERDDPEVKGGFYGLTMKHGRAEMLRSIYEGVAFSIHKRVSLLEQAGCKFSEMRVSGGGAQSSLWNQIKADVLNMPVRAIADVDGAELGAAMLGAIGLGYFATWQDAVNACVPEGTLYLPDQDRTVIYKKSYERFIDLENRLRLS